MWDAADQLGSLTYRLNGAVTGDIGYGYDALGRRVSTTGSFNRPQLPPAVDLPVGPDGRTQNENGVTLSYDPNGRLTQDVQFYYVWNELGQLTELRNRSDNALRATYLYDPTGRRVQKTLDGLSTRYLHDGANPVQLQEADGALAMSGTASASADSIEVYTEVLCRSDFSTQPDKATWKGCR